MAAPTAAERDAAQVLILRQIVRVLVDMSARYDSSESARQRDRETTDRILALLTATLLVRFGRAMERHGWRMLVGAAILVWSSGAVAYSLLYHEPIVAFPSLLGAP